MQRRPRSSCTVLDGLTSRLRHGFVDTKGCGDVVGEGETDGQDAGVLDCLSGTLCNIGEYRVA